MSSWRNSRLLLTPYRRATPPSMSPRSPPRSAGCSSETWQTAGWSASGPARSMLTSLPLGSTRGTLWFSPTVWSESQRQSPGSSWLSSALLTDAATGSTCGEWVAVRQYRTRAWLQPPSSTNSSCHKITFETAPSIDLPHPRKSEFSRQRSRHQQSKNLKNAVLEVYWKKQKNFEAVKAKHCVSGQRSGEVVAWEVQCFEVRPLLP